MEMRRFGLVAVALFTALAIVQIPVSASADCEVMEATIDLLGYKVAGDAGSVVLKLDDVSDVQWVGSRVFYLHENLGNAGYATLLTAFSLEKTVRVRTQFGTCAGGDTITHIYINP